jgi:hypothetical protein
VALGVPWDLEPVKGMEGGVSRGIFPEELLPNRELCQTIAPDGLNISEQAALNILCAPFSLCSLSFLLLNPCSSVFIRGSTFAALRLCGFALNPFFPVFAGVKQSLLTA